MLPMIFFVIVNVSTTNKNELTFTVLKWRQNSQRWISHNFFSHISHMFFSKVVAAVAHRIL